MRLGSLARPELIFTDLPGTDRAGVLHAFAERIAGQGLTPNAVDLYQQLLERAQLGSTGIGGGIAIPHCKLSGLKRGVLAIGLVPQAADVGAVDGRAGKGIFLIVSPSEAPADLPQGRSATSR